MNKVERVKTVLAGGTPDVVPAGFWFHYPHEYTVRETVDAHMELYEHTGMDVVKIMYDVGYALDIGIKQPSDWYRIKPEGVHSKFFQKQLDIVRGIGDRLGGEAMAFVTMFGPFKLAVMATSDELVMEHCKQDPKAVAAGVSALADAMAEWAGGYLDVSDGIYYSAQFSEPQRFTKEQWEQLVRPYDERVLNVAANRTGKYNMLHICGEPEHQFKTNVRWFAGYPADIVNWSVKDNGVSLSEGREIFKRPILGGLNNKGNILTGTHEQIRAEVRAAVDGFGVKGLMIGADCTIQGKIDEDRIRAAVEAAHEIKGE